MFLKTTKNNFEKELKNKLFLTGQDPKSILIQTFNIFDKDGSKGINRSEWLRVVKILGITMFSNNILLELFDEYDEYKKNSIDVKKFINNLFPQNIKDSLNKSDKKDIITLMKRKYSGIKNFIIFNKALSLVDTDNNNLINVEELKRANQEFNLDLNNDDIINIFIAFDDQRSGQINIVEIINSLKEQLNDFRKFVIEKTFYELEKFNCLKITDILTVFNPKLHPDVKKGIRREDDIVSELMESFEFHHKIFSPDLQVVTREEWSNYFYLLSNNINDDKYFEAILNCWNFDYRNRINSTKSSNSNSDNLRTSSIIESLRRKILSKGFKCIFNLSRILKSYDFKNTNLIDLNKLTVAFKELYNELDIQEIETLFRYLDNKNVGYIDYNELIQIINGEMNPGRKKLILQVFNQLDFDRKGYLYLHELKAQYIPSNHPDFKRQIKTEEDIFIELLEAFEYQLSYKNKGRKDKVFFENFLEYYTFISSCVESDEYFNYLLTSLWNFNKQTIYKNDLNNIDINTKLNNSFNQKCHLDNNFQPRPLAKSINNIKDLHEYNLYKNTVEDKTVDIIINIRSILIRRGLSGLVALLKSFNSYDKSSTKTVEVYQFKNIFNFHRLNILSESDFTKLLMIYDAHKIGKIYYQSFTKALIGEMNNFRRSLIKRLYNSLKKNSLDFIELDDLLMSFKPSLHPDVKLGKKLEDEVLGEILNSIEYYYTTLNKANNKIRILTIEELYSFFDIISMTILEDSYFEIMVNSCWNF